MRVFASALFVCAALFAADAPKPPAQPVQPKLIPFSQSAQQNIAALKAEDARLVREMENFERAIRAERANLGLQGNAIFDRECRAAGGENCQATTQGDDPAKWGFVVVPKPPGPEKPKP